MQMPARALGTACVRVAQPGLLTNRDAINRRSGDRISRQQQPWASFARHVAPRSAGAGAGAVAVTPAFVVQRSRSSGQLQLARYLWGRLRISEPRSSALVHVQRHCRGAASTHTHRDASEPRSLPGLFAPRTTAAPCPAAAHRATQEPACLHAAAPAKTATDTAWAGCQRSRHSAHRRAAQQSLRRPTSPNSR